MADFIAWMGIALGLAVGVALAVFFFCSKYRPNPVPDNALGLILSGEGLAEAPRESLRPEAPPGKSPEEETPSQARPISRSRSSGTGDPSPAIPTGLQGNLTQVPLHDFLQFLAQGNRTGTLEIVSGRRLGYIGFARGQMTLCSFRGRQGQAALHSLLPLGEGDFEFYEGEGFELPPTAQGGEFKAPLAVVDALMHWDAQKRVPPREAKKQE